VAVGCRLQPNVSLPPQVTWPLFNSLQGFWPGMQLLVGEREMALDTMRAFHALWRHLGFHPEGFNLASMQTQPGQLGYPLRPEHVESLFWAHRTTHGGEWLRAGRDVLRSLQTLRVPCGVVCLSDVANRTREDVPPAQP
jgi:mannosidase alpha-like ER degradation enhancer 2